MKRTGLVYLSAGILLALFTSIFCLASAAAEKPSPKAYVAEFGSSDVAVIDTNGYRVLKRIPVPKGAHGVAMTPDGSRVFVSSDESAVISVIDTANDTVKSTIPTGKAPHGLAVSKDGRHVYAAVFGDNQILQIDSASLKVERTYEAPAPHNLAISSDEKFIYVAAQKPGQTGVAQIDTSTGKQTAFFVMKNVPRSLNLSVDGNSLCVTQFDSNAVQVLSTHPLKPAATVDVGSAPHHVIFTPDGKSVLVCNQGSNDVTVIDSKTWKVIAKIPAGQKPHWIAPSSDGEYALVTDETSGQVTVLDLEERKIESTIQVGELPRKIAIQPGSIAEKAKTEEAGDQHAVVKMEGPPPRFVPETLVIEAGTTVEWINTGKKMHTVTEENSAWDSGSLNPGEKFSRRFDQKGTIKYYCVPHHELGMTGTIIVK